MNATRRYVGRLGAAQQYSRVAVARILRNHPNDVEDVLQEAAIRALVALRQGRFRGESRLETWFVRIAINAALMHIRGEVQHRRRLTSVEDDGEGDTAALEIESMERSPLERAQANEVVARVRAEIAALSPKLRDAAEQWLAGERAVDPTIKSRRHRAKVKLQARLMDMGGGAPSNGGRHAEVAC